MCKNNLNLKEDMRPIHWEQASFVEFILIREIILMRLMRLTRSGQINFDVPTEQQNKGHVGVPN